MAALAYSIALTPASTLQESIPVPIAALWMLFYTKELSQVRAQPCSSLHFASLAWT